MAGEGGPNIEEIFEHARGLPPEERPPYLDGACGGNAAARARVEALLSALDRAGGFLASPDGPHPGMIGDLGSAAIGEGPGSRIGPYRLLQLIGEGGFGSVFMAEQERPVRRRVALKIIKLGMDTRQVIARFEAERQALAMMDHPNIARVLDAGATDAGRPYFVMELVRGEPINVYCDKNNIAIHERLGLFSQVCRAVQHAHTKGVIHRDLKPGNILVGTQDGRSVAKVIDFGIAKATDHRLTEKTVFTEFRQFIGTPEYMSPEQAEGSLDIDTRTDVYSLGVLLYELLTGTTPFDTRTLRSAAYAEVQRIIREVEPPRPSTRLSTFKETLASVAAQRRIDPARLSTLLRGDLDWIVMKALEKDRARRYDGAGSLAADIERFLGGQAVEAAPPGAAYKARKFVRRHRGPVVAAALVTAALVLGLAGTLAGLVRAARDRDRAIVSEHLAAERFEEAQKARAESERLGALATARAEEAEKARDQAERMNKIASAVTEFFTQDLMDLPPTPEGVREPTVRDVLENAPAKIERYFSKEPAVAGIIRERIGQIYFNLGDVRKAEAYLEPALSLLEQGLGPENAQTLMAAQRLAELCFETGRLDRAEELFGTLHERRLRTLGPDHNFTWNSLLRRGLARAYQGKNDQAVADAEKAYDEIKARRGEGSRPALIFSVQLIECYRVAGRLDESERFARRMLELIGANLKDQAPAEPHHRLELALTLLAMNRPKEALAELDGVIGSFEISYPAGHPRLVVAQAAHAEAMARAGRPAEARPLLEAAYAAFEKTYGPAGSQTRAVAGTLAGVCDQLADPDAAKVWRARAVLTVPER